MDIRISGSGNIGAGEYDDMRISGSGKVEGPVRCKSFYCSGSSRCTGTIDASEDIRIAGSTHVDGDVRTSNLTISGSSTVTGHCIAQNEVRVAGSFRCGSNLKANQLRGSGNVHMANVEAEEVQITGRIVCSGLLNAEKIEIQIDGCGSEIGSVGGSSIHIGTNPRKTTKINLLFFKNLLTKTKGGSRQLTVRDSIEGNDITLDHVTAHIVTGRTVKIGSGCHIEQVQYSDSIEIAPDATVGTQTKI